MLEARNGRVFSTYEACRLGMLSLGAMALVSCASPTEDPLSPQSTTALEDVSGMDLLIPARVGPDGSPWFEDRTLQHRDYSAVQHALASVGRVMRDSEMGHEGYRPELAGDPMTEQGRAWLRVMQSAERFHDNERFAGTLEASDEGWQPGRDLWLNELAQAAFSYHMHHSAGRWEGTGLFEPITFGSSPYLADITKHLIKQHHESGRFHHGDGRVDQDSMAYGLDAWHSLSYSWVRWYKPGGADDMGLIPEDRMASVHGLDRTELLNQARDLAETLDAAWEEQLGAYDFGNGGLYSLDALGSLVRGHKGVYEVLYVFGSDEDRDSAEQLFQRNADMLMTVLESDAILKPWGLVSAVEFHPGGVRAASDHVDTEAQWRFVNHLTGGFGILREREGTSSFLESRPELGPAVGQFNDQLFLSAL
ncbi:hypothetical protein LRB11_16795, partial [Ectothiorhodospira haloalkaliphila]|uniref:hypothetical protein n=1 Tax=Ectothiorhodospira haloalkaliphila TaxID=421628 RepID=UPI001EE8051D